MWEPITGAGTAILTAIGSVFASAVDMVGDVASTIIEQPILLIFAILPVVGLGVGLFKRLISVN